MPKDEFDFEDPFELNGMAFLTHEDTTNDMAECFIEEFMRMGYSHQQLLALFRNPHYLGPNMAFEKRGEPFIRDLIADVFARWGKAVTWPDPGSSRREAGSSLHAVCKPKVGRLVDLGGYDPTCDETAHRPDGRADSQTQRVTAPPFNRLPFNQP